MPAKAACDIIVPADCRCYTAVCNAYQNMITRGSAQQDAIGVALRIYCHYHPETHVDRAQLIVESWTRTGDTRH